MCGDIKVKRHSVLDELTKTLALARLRYWKQEGLAKFSFTAVRRSGSILCILRMQSRIQKEARFGGLF